MAAANDVALIQCPHRIYRHFGKPQFAEQFGSRPRHFYQLEQTKRAVLIKKVVIKIDVFQFPQMINQPIKFRLIQIQGVLPHVPVFHVRIFLDFLHIGHKGKATRIAPRQTAIHIEERIIGFG